VVIKEENDSEVE